MVEITGRCFCGQVKWRTQGPVLWSGICHCDSCRRATSSPATAFFGVPRVSLEWTGALAEHQTAQGEVSRLYCPNCGTQMSYQANRWPEEAHLYAATMERPADFVPEAHFHYAERLPWIEIADDLPKYPASADTTDPL